MTIFEKADKRLLPNFSRQIVSVNGNHVLVVIGGSSPPCSCCTAILKLTFVGT